MVLKEQQRINTDVLIIGGGGAGLRAAIAAAEKGARVLLVSYSRAGYGNNTAIAFGYMSVVIKREDSTQAYTKDTISAGCLINNRKLVNLLAAGSVNQVHDLEQLGITFVRKDGELAVSLVPGHSYPRTIAAVNKGLGFTVPLKAKAEALGVNFLEGVSITKLVNGAAIKGAIGINNKGVPFVIEAKAVILATGGLGQLYANSSNAVWSSGDGYALAYEIGAALQDMEMVQFYPTATTEGNVKQIVLYESIVAQEGAIIRNSEGEDVLQRHRLTDPKSMTRDRLARIMMTEIIEGRHIKGALMLDLSNLSNDALNRIQHILPKRLKMLYRNNVSVAPVAHFQMGGIRIDDNCRTGIDGLFAAGEVCGGIHGANRLGGNSLTEIFVFGEKAGIKAAEEAMKRHKPVILKKEIDAECERLSLLASSRGDCRLNEIESELKNTMLLNSGIIRSRQSLNEALVDIERCRKSFDKAMVGGPEDILDAITINNMLTVSEIIVRSALMRDESRGAHFRADYPEQNDQEWVSNVVISKKNQAINLRTTEVES